MGPTQARRSHGKTESAGETTHGPTTNEIAIYTDGSVIRQVGYQPGWAGTEYMLNGIPMANLTQGLSTGQSYDAAFDGQNVYQVNYPTGNVARYDTLVQNEVILFNVGNTFDQIGITYDDLTNTIWTSGFSPNLPGVVKQWNLNGNLISSFATGGRLAALAWDPLG